MAEQCAILEARDSQHAQLLSAHEALQWDSQQTITSLSNQNKVGSETHCHHLQSTEVL